MVWKTQITDDLPELAREKAKEAVEIAFSTEDLKNWWKSDFESEVKIESFEDYDALPMDDFLLARADYIYSVKSPIMEKVLHDLGYSTNCDANVILEVDDAVSREISAAIERAAETYDYEVNYE